MVNRFRELDPSMFISAALQCPLALRYFYLRKLIQQAQLDALFIQFYNNEGCDAVITGPDDAFNDDAWEDVISSATRVRMSSFTSASMQSRAVLAISPRRRCSRWCANTKIARTLAAYRSGI